MGYAALLQLAIGLYGEEKAKNMTREQLDVLREQLAGVQRVPLPNIQTQTPDQLGESAVAGMKSDQTLRAKQLQALGTIQNLIDSGGLDLTDKASLEDATSQALNQQKRARAGVAADAAARGQMNSGNRLVMDLDAAQAGSNAARKTGMETAALAQRRRLDAIRDASTMSGALREQDWREGEAAARAKDIRDERNASAREKAQYYNAGIPQQQFTNALGKATGQLPSANAYAGGLAAGATDARASAAGMAGVVGAYGNANNTAGQTYTYDPEIAKLDENGQRGGYTDLSRGDDK